MSFLSPIKGLVEKATVDDATPTPGYLFNELIKLSHSSVDDCSKLQDFLLKRLEKESPNVKMKVLKIVKHILLKGHSSFRSDLRRRTEVLRACLDYRGPADPLRGDYVSKVVRDEAQAIMDLLFAEARTKQMSRPMHGMGSGSDSSSTSASSRSSSSAASSPQSSSSSSSTFGSRTLLSSAPHSGPRKKMEGMGNVTFDAAPPSSASSGGVMGVFGMVKDGISSWVTKAQPDSWDLSPDPSFPSTAVSARSSSTSLSNGSLPPQSSTPPSSARAAGSAHQYGGYSGSTTGRTKYKPGGVWAQRSTQASAVDDGCNGSGRPHGDGSGDGVHGEWTEGGEERVHTADDAAYRDPWIRREESASDPIDRPHVSDEPVHVTIHAPPTASATARWGRSGEGESGAPAPRRTSEHKESPGVVAVKTFLEPVGVRVLPSRSEVAALVNYGKGDWYVFSREGQHHIEHKCMLKKRGSDAVGAMEEETTAFDGVAALRELENAPQKSLREKSATVLKLMRNAGVQMDRTVLREGEREVEEVETTRPRDAIFAGVDEDDGARASSECVQDESSVPRGEFEVAVGTVNSGAVADDAVQTDDTPRREDPQPSGGLDLLSFDAPTHGVAPFSSAPGRDGPSPPPAGSSLDLLADLAVDDTTAGVSTELDQTPQDNDPFSFIAEAMARR